MLLLCEIGINRASDVLGDNEVVLAVLLTGPANGSFAAWFCLSHEFADFVLFIPSKCRSETIVFREIALLTGELEISENVVSAIYEREHMIQKEVPDNKPGTVAAAVSLSFAQDV